MSPVVTRQRIIVPLRMVLPTRSSKIPKLRQGTCLEHVSIKHAGAVQQLRVLGPSSTRQQIFPVFDHRSRRVSSVRMHSASAGSSRSLVRSRASHLCQCQEFVAVDHDRFTKSAQGNLDWWCQHRCTASQLTENFTQLQPQTALH